MSVAPHNTVNPVPAVTVFIAGGVVIVPPCAFMLITISEVEVSFVLAIVIVPAFVQMNVPLRALPTFIPPLNVPRPAALTAPVNVTDGMPEVGLPEIVKAAAGAAVDAPVYVLTKKVQYDHARFAF